MGSLNQRIFLSGDGSKALDLLFNRDESNRRYLVDFYALFQILKLLRGKDFYIDDLRSMLSVVQNELNKPPLPSKVDSYQIKT